eukprot:CAMPEP_0175887026 /NCGR_PEP_ID=MMETSP0107_2-20121207/45946_1 /TAXON_ID=195067 ORGANISM="Goniomonas pacifica, Strain CCMP1869" /NCGR_SAMPLE_ID=MMETSP0107_2 /ASSEMBLY_ACC=CAM_ASM_000203 /LENGTH=299 /DNA_ID=CAMNT_0017207439 /DNA_START=8 /DNA_END=904 /DNA_ORIENTATION=+
MTNSANDAMSLIAQEGGVVMSLNESSGSHPSMSAMAIAPSVVGKQGGALGLPPRAAPLACAALEPAPPSLRGRDRCYLLNELLQLDEEVAKVDLKGRHVLAQVKQTHHKGLGLGRSDVGEGLGEELVHVLTDELLIGGHSRIRYWVIERDGHGPSLDAVHAVHEDGSLELEACLVHGVREDDEDVVSRVELVRDLPARLHVGEQIVEDGESRLGDVALVVLEGPDDGVDDQLEVVGRDEEEGTEAVVVDRLEEFEKVDAVVRVVLEVLRDHLESAVEDALEDERNPICDCDLGLVDDGG